MFTKIRKVLINYKPDKPALIQKNAWRRTGDKQSFQTMLV